MLPFATSHYRPEAEINLGPIAVIDSSAVLRNLPLGQFTQLGQSGSWPDAWDRAAICRIPAVGL